MAWSCVDDGGSPYIWSCMMLEEVMAWSCVDDGGSLYNGTCVGMVMC